MKLGELDQGSRGQQVQMLQHLLNTTDRLRPPLDLDGLFGPRTDRAVRRYQARHKLEIDGIVGPRTWLTLGARSAILPDAPVYVPAPPSPRMAAATRSVPIPGARRVAALVPAAAAVPRATTPPLRRAQPLAEMPGTAITAPWMRVALAEEGVREIVGRQHTRRIVEYHSVTSLAAKEDEVPWCASFVNWCLQKVGIRGNNSARARDFGSWGQKLDQPRYGCVVHLFKSPRGVDGRTGSSSGNHVAFFVGQTTTQVSLLGGNQGNRVRISNYPLNQYQVKAMRWPSDR